jgi:hypothetical protein
MFAFRSTVEHGNDDLALDHLLIVTGLDLLDQRPNSEQRLEEPFRSRLVEELERSLVNKQRFKLYMRALDEILGRREPSAAEIGEDDHNSVLDKGLAVLSDRDLLRLALDGPALWALRICINDDGGPYWKTVSQDLAAVQEGPDVDQLVTPVVPATNPVGKESADFLESVPAVAARIINPRSPGPAESLRDREIGRIRVNNLERVPPALACAEKTALDEQVWRVPLSAWLQQTGLEDALTWAKELRLYANAFGADSIAEFDVGIPEVNDTVQGGCVLRVTLLADSGERASVDLTPTWPRIPFEPSFPSDPSRLTLVVELKDISERHGHVS